jgi:hypothetical protein
MGTRHLLYIGFSPTLPLQCRKLQLPGWHFLPFSSAAATDFDFPFKKLRGWRFMQVSMFCRGGRKVRLINLPIPIRSSDFIGRYNRLMSSSDFCIGRLCRFVLSRVSDPHRFNADPDTDPDPEFFVIADPDSGSGSRIRIPDPGLLRKNISNLFQETF